MNLGKEDETREFKESLSQLDKGLKSLTAMLNRSGHGTVYFGVDDSGNVKGFTVGKKTLLDIRNRIRDIIEPQILAEIKEHVTDDGKTYISVSATGCNIPYSCDGRYYVRNASADESVSNELLRKMLASGDADLIKQIESDIQNLTFNQFVTFLSGYDIHISDKRSALKNYGLLNADNKYNLMAYLLSDQNDTSIKVVKFSGMDKSAMSERTEFGRQCLLVTVKQVLDYMRAMNSTRVDLSNGARIETPMFEYESFREAWINACLHNSWNERIPPAVYVFDDRIEIVSYGGLPYDLSKDGFFNGVSKPVNKSLLTLFILSNYSEQSGHGIPTIVSAYGREAFSFEDRLLKVKLKFAFEPDMVTARKMREHRRAKLTEKQMMILAYLSEHPFSKLQEAADATGVSLAGAKKIVSRLQELELLRRSGSKRDGHWEKVDFESKV